MVKFSRSCKTNFHNKNISLHKRIHSKKCFFSHLFLDSNKFLDQHRNKKETECQAGFKLFLNPCISIIANNSQCDYSVMSTCMTLHITFHCGLYLQETGKGQNWLGRGMGWGGSQARNVLPQKWQRRCDPFPLLYRKEANTD